MVVISVNVDFSIKMVETLIENLIKLFGNESCDINIIESHHKNKIEVHFAI